MNIFLYFDFFYYFKQLFYSFSELKPLNENKNNEDQDSKKGVSQIVIGILKEIVNVRLLKENLPFLLITLSNFFIFFVYFIPFIYIPIRAKELKIPNYPLLLSIIGKFFHVFKQI